MESKNQRLAQISDIIQNEQVRSQEQLLKTLLSQGFSVTQATLSRDLKKLKVAKVPDMDGTYRYVLPEMAVNNVPSNLPNALNYLDGFLGIEFAGNMGVVKTMPAFASAISSAIDTAGLYCILGTIAGDDTIFLVIREGKSDQDVKKELVSRFPDLVDKLT